MPPGIALLAVFMLLTGAVNTITTKLQDEVLVGGIGFKHPAVQSACMFFGELLCLIPYLILTLRAHRSTRAKTPAADAEVPLLSDQEAVTAGSTAQHAPHHSMAAVLSFALPAMCDAVATTLLNLGLYYTYASTYQMLRGTMVLFAGAFTVLLLRRALHVHHWMAAAMIAMGAALVGMSSIVYRDDDDAAAAPSPSAYGGANDGASKPLLGDALVVAAQVFQALQFIVEEKFLAQHRVPALLAVGLEGAWGVALSLVALPALTFIKGADGVAVDDARLAVKQIAASQQLQLLIAASIISIAFFNFFGVSVTKSLSGAARAAIDACRTLLVWIFAVSTGSERFHSLQLVGFVVLLSGTSLYNEIFFTCIPRSSKHGHHTRHHGNHHHHHNHHEHGGQPAQHAQQQDDQSTAEPLLQPQQPTAVPHPIPHAPRPPLHPSTLRAVGGTAASSSPYTMARSLRCGPAVLTPHSIGSAGLPRSFSPSFTTTEFGVSYDPSASNLLSLEAASSADAQHHASSSRIINDDDDDISASSPSAAATSPGREGQRTDFDLSACIDDGKDTAHHATTTFFAGESTTR